MKLSSKRITSLLFGAFFFVLLSTAAGGAGSAFADSGKPLLTEQKLKSKMCKLISEFKKFEGTASFVKWGFSQAGPHHSWLKELEALWSIEY